MKKNLKLLSGIIMASFISNCAIGNLNMDVANARHSRKVVVNSGKDIVNANDVTEAEEDSSTLYSNLENEDEEVMDDVAEISAEEDNTESVDEMTDEEASDEEIIDEEAIDEETTDEEVDGEQNIMEYLNSSKDLEMDDIVNLVKPVAYSLSFRDELNTTFPDFEPLRELSPQINMKATQYIDVNENKIKDFVTFLSPYSEQANAYSEQNISSVLIKQISSNLTELNDEISKQKNSTIFSLLPTMMAFSDTLKILSTDYNFILQDNSDNQIRLNILLKDIEKQLSSLLAATNEFKKMLPESIEMLDKLADSTSSGTSAKDDTDEDTTDEESTEEQTTDEIESETASEETADETIQEEVVEEEETVEEKIDPKKVNLFFGSSGQELTFNEKDKKYYEQDPEDPEGLIEYTGEVKKMTLEEYLNIDLFLDKDGRELIFDKDTNSYFSYNPETDEFSVYEGEVKKIKMKDLLEQAEN